MTFLWDYVATWTTMCTTASVCGPSEPSKTPRQLIRECERKVARYVLEQRRALQKYTTRNKALENNIRELVRSGAKRDDRRLYQAACELQALRGDTNKLYIFIAQLQTLAQEVAAARMNVTRYDAVANSTGVMQVLNTMTPPVQVMETMREFSRQMTTAGIADERADAMFESVNEPLTEVDDAEINNLITKVISGVPLTHPRLSPLSTSIAEAGSEDDVATESPVAQSMQARVAALAQ